jgi:membrane associated rhomboid family serine protease
MRTEYPRGGTSILTWMLSAMLAGFVLNLILTRWLNLNLLEPALAVSPAGLRQWHLWTLLTYPLLHADVLHILFNGLGLYLIGRELVGPLGSRRFLALSIAASLSGGLLWFACHYNQGPLILLGASSIVASLFIVFACIFPEREVTFLLFFVLPITLRPKILAWILVSIDLLGFLFAELPGGTFDRGIAHSAHLGGMLAGWLFYHYFYANNGLDRAASFELPAWLRRRKSGAPAATGTFKVDIQSRANLRSEVDRILDKINSQGFGALTDHEKKLLDEAKDLLSRH